jgi:hypothetical protein
MISVLDHFGSGLAYGTSTGISNGVNGYTSASRTFGAPSSAPLINGAQQTSQPIAPGQTCPVTYCTTIYAPLSKVFYDSAYGYWEIQRDGFRGPLYNRADTRLQETFKIKEKYKAIVAVEAFNVLNHSNFSGFATSANSATYGQPTAGGAAGVSEYSSRQLQFIGRFSF